MTNLGSAESREMARQILRRETAGITDEAALGAAMQCAYDRVAERLSRAVGADGYTALLARGLSRAQHSEPILMTMRQVQADRISIDVVAGTAANGAREVHGALEALFAAIADILGDLIGADMVSNLLDHDETGPTQDERRAQ